jgi:hypothetical protein
MPLPLVAFRVRRGYGLSAIGRANGLQRYGELRTLPIWPPLTVK